MRFLSRVAILLLCLAPLGGAASAQSKIDQLRADTTKAGAKTDSSAVKVDSSVATPPRFSPTTTSYFRGSDIEMVLGSSADASSLPGGGWSLLSSVMVERRRYRGQDLESLAENLLNRASKIEPGLYRLNMSAGESYNKRKSQGLGRFNKVIVYDNQTANLGVNFIKPILGASQSAIVVSAGGSQGLNDFKYDRSLNGMLSSSLIYDFKDFVRVGGGYGTTRQRESSKVGRVMFGPLPSSTDTLRAIVAFGKPTARLLDVSYDRSEGEDRVVTPPRGNSLEILDDPSKAKREVIRTTNEGLVVNSLLHPFPFTVMNLSLEHNRSSQVYAIDTTLTKSSRGDRLSASTSYRFARTGSASADIYTSKNLADFGPSSLSSYREKENSINAIISDSLTSSLYVSMSGTARLQQRFFLKSAVNPRDADYLYYRGDASFWAAPFHGINTGVSAMVSRYETRNIDATQSGDNRVDFLYQVIPQVSVKPAKWLTISQQYTIKIEYTNFVYTADKNYLNRTTSLSTNAGFVLSPQFSFSLTHSYYMKDTGSYLSSGAKKLYDPNNRNTDHKLFIDLQYNPVTTFGIRALGDFSFQRSDNLTSENGHRVIFSSSDFQSGGMLLGFTHNRKIGQNGEIKLDIAYNRRYSPGISAERREYWDADSQIVLGF